MEKIIWLLMGASGCGKSTLEKQLLTKDDVYRVVSTTTRDRRDDEIDGTTYHFVNKTEFNKMLNDGEFIQTTEFAYQQYGTTKSEYTTPHPISVLSIAPESAVEFIPIIRETFPNYTIKIIFFDISNVRLRDNMLARGDKEDDVKFRIRHDDLVEQFQKAGFVPDCVISDIDLDEFLGERIRENLLEE